MMPQKITKIINQTVNKLYGLPVKAEIHYPESQFGDFATNVAFGLAKELMRSPIEIAAEISEAVADDQIKEVTAVNGFINIKMTPEFWIEQISAIKPTYAQSNYGGNKKVQVEFISANPTGPLTLANGRGGFMGDVLSNVLEQAGYKVEREYYVNDAGNQILALGKTLKGQEILYAGDYISELKSQVDTSKDASEVGREAAEVMLGQIKQVARKMGISFDRWFSERSVIESGRVVQVIDMLKSADYAYEKEGALWLRTSEHNDDKDRVLRKSDGELTYLASDIAHYYETFVSDGFNQKINILGPDHHGYVARMQAAVEMLREARGFEGDSKILITQVIRLIKEGREIKMSKRAGTYVAIDDLIEEVGSSVARFFFLMRSIDTHIDFDLDLAKEHSQKNPFYYVMYSYARANSIIEQAKLRGLSPIGTLSELTQPELNLIRHMAKLPELVTVIARDYGVHKLTFFGIEAAKLFHELYESEKIIDLDKAKASKKLYIIKQYIIFMDVYWKIMGIIPQKRMESTA